MFSDLSTLGIAAKHTKLLHDYEESHTAAHSIQTINHHHMYSAKPLLITTSKLMIYRRLITLLYNASRIKHISSTP